MPKIVDKIAKAQAISDAAIKVFRQQGYHETRMADIAGAAGVGKGTLYEYFTGKPDILRHAFEEHFRAFSKDLAEALEEVSGPLARLMTLIDFALGHAGEWEDQCAVYIDCFSSPKSRKNLFSLSCMYDPIKEIIAGLIREGQEKKEIDNTLDPLVMAQLFVSIYDGIILHRMLQGQAMDRVLLHKAALRLLKKGMAADL